LDDRETDNEEDDKSEEIPSEDDDTLGESPLPADGNMIFKCTEGAAVFVNDVYKGEISGGSLSTRKLVGTLSIRLTKQGYITKKYTVTVEDDGEDAEFVFPEMVAE